MSPAGFHANAVLLLFLLAGCAARPTSSLSLPPAQFQPSDVQIRWMVASNVACRDLPDEAETCDVMSILEQFEVRDVSCSTTHVGPGRINAEATCHFGLLRRRSPDDVRYACQSDMEFVYETWFDEIAQYYNWVMLSDPNPPQSLPAGAPIPDCGSKM